MQLNKINKTALVVVTVLVVILFVSIVLAILGKQNDDNIPKESEFAGISTEVISSETEEIEVVETETEELSEVETEAEQVVTNTEDTSTNIGTTSNNGSQNQGNTNAGNTNQGSTSGSNSNLSSSGQIEVDTSGDEWTPTDEWREDGHINPYEQAVIDAGYGNVVKFSDDYYGVLAHKDGLINGQEGNEYLRDYLTNLGLEPTHVNGGIIDESKDYYWYSANEVHEIKPPAGDWNEDEEEIEFMD